MMFFVSKINSYSCVNNKGREVQKWLESFAHHLIPNELSKDAWIEDLRLKLQDFDKQFPRSTPLHLDKVSVDAKTPHHFTIYPKNHPEKYVAVFDIHKVVGEYRFNEVILPKLEKGGLR